MTDFATYPSLAGKTVFVTGGGSGIGASIVEHFCRQKAHVHFVDLDRESSQALAASMADKGYPAPVFEYCDLRDIPELKRIISKTVEASGTVDVLVNNAAHDERHAVEDVTVEYWEDRMHVNLRHQFFAAQAVFPAMRAAQRGAIVNMGSSSWHIGQGGMPGYTSAKAAIEGLTRGLARDFGPYNIRVNCVIPGWIMTERQQQLWLTPESEQDLMKNQCLKKKVYPADVARLVLWLSADDSAMCTNQNYVVDGGWL